MTFQAKGGLLADPKPMEVHAGVGDIKPWDADSWAKFEQMGKPRPRAEAPLKVTGRAKYTYDVKLPGMLYGRMIGATIPAGEIVSIDTSRAEALPGVKAVWTADSKLVRFAGQDVAAVAAVSPEIAMDAARLVKVTYKEKPFTIELREAMKPDAPLVFTEAESPAGKDVPRKGNVFGPGARSRGNRGDLDKGFAEAEVVHEGTYYCPVHTHSPLETHGVVASWEGDQLTVYASTQGIFAVREGLAEALGIDRKNVRVICEHMGGGFGSKLGPSASGSAFAMAACKLAKKAGAPVKMMLDRKQQHLCTGNAPSALMTVKVGAKKDGTMTAVHYKSYGLGRRRRRRGDGGAGGRAPRQEPELQGRGVRRLHERGPGGAAARPRPLAGRLRHRVGGGRAGRQARHGPDRAAEEERGEPGPDGPVRPRREGDRLGSAATRRPATRRPATGDRPGHRQRARRRDGFTPARRRGGTGGHDAMSPRSKKARGIGMANGNWYVFAAEDSNAQVKVHRDGSVEVITGCQDIGTGYRTAMMVVAAEELGIEPEAVTVRLGDTRFPEGPGSGGSVTINSMAPVVRLAANQARTKLFALAAPLLGVAAEELDAANGKIFVAKDKAKSVTFKQAAAKMSGETIDCLAKRGKQYETFRGDLAGTQFAEVEVDTETGEVRVIKMVSVNDCGLPVNPLTTQNQVIGAMIQGASWALLENRILDRQVGTMVNPNLEWYKIFAPADMFEAKSILTPVANLGNNTSTAGIGEPPIVPTLAVIANAVYNAIGVRIRELPITPDRVLAALSEAKRRA